MMSIRKFLSSSTKFNGMIFTSWRIALIFIPLIGAVFFIFGIALEFNLREVSIYTEAIKIISLISYLVCLYGLWTVAKGKLRQV
jgi:hypothetical protein